MSRLIGPKKEIIEKLRTPVHVYECEDCIVTFSVEQAFEDQSVVKCPVCLTDDHLRDIASGTLHMLIRR